MKILIVCSGNFNLSFEISQAFIYDQIQALKKLGVEIDLFLVKGMGMKGYVKNLKALKKKIKTNNYTLVHAHGGLSGLLSNLQRMLPVITTFHGTDINNPKLRLFSSLAHLLNYKSIFVSTALRNKVKFFTKKQYVIPCGVDFSLFHPMDKNHVKKELGLSENKKYILFSSSFENSNKNYPLLHEALKINPNDQIEVIELKNYTRKEVVKLMNAVDICTMTSFMEGSPQFIKEAMACNCPIVSTDVGDVKDIIKHTDGCYLTTFSAKDVALKIDKALNFGKKTNGREHLKNFDNELIAQKLFQVYQKTIKRKINDHNC
ncbi:MAG: glycosyltransferase family 4 protein [Candidatus Atribacteria bacterium]|nr:glycosyltransferase family 4 protein [Candidatus Atribacteria bacterium]